MENIRVHLLKSGMVLDKITIGLLVVCLIIVILYMVFQPEKETEVVYTTPYVPITTTNKKKLY